MKRSIADVNSGSYDQISVPINKSEKHINALSEIFTTPKREINVPEYLWILPDGLWEHFFRLGNKHNISKSPIFLLLRELFELIYLSLGPPWRITFLRAIFFKVRCCSPVIYMRGGEYGTYCAREVVRHGLSITKYFVDNNYLKKREAYCNACFCGNNEICSLYHNKKYNLSAFIAAANGGQAETIQHLRDIGLTIKDDKLRLLIVKSGKVNLYKQMIESNYDVFENVRRIRADIKLACDNINFKLYHYLIKKTTNWMIDPSIEHLKLVLSKTDTDRKKDMSRFVDFFSDLGWSIRQMFELVGSIKLNSIQLEILIQRGLILTEEEIISLICRYHGFLSQERIKYIENNIITLTPDIIKKIILTGSEHGWQFVAGCKEAMSSIKWTLEEKIQIAHEYGKPLFFLYPCKYLEEFRVTFDQDEFQTCFYNRTSDPWRQFYSMTRIKESYPQLLFTKKMMNYFLFNIVYAAPPDELRKHSTLLNLSYILKSINEIDDKNTVTAMVLGIGFIANFLLNEGYDKNIEQPYRYFFITSPSKFINLPKLPGATQLHPIYEKILSNRESLEQARTDFWRTYRICKPDEQPTKLINTVIFNQNRGLYNVTIKLINR